MVDRMRWPRVWSLESPGGSAMPMENQQLSQSGVLQKGLQGDE